MKITDKTRQNLSRGQDLAEYSLFIGLIALLVIISITLIGGDIRDIFTALAAALQTGI
jgi:Flp pilus assembly pilin Flp